jgi:hypothetical protein
LGYQIERITVPLELGVDPSPTDCPQKTSMTGSHEVFGGLWRQLLEFDQALQGVIRFLEVAKRDESAPQCSSAVRRSLGTLMGPRQKLESVVEAIVELRNLASSKENTSCQMVFFG